MKPVEINFFAGEVRVCGETVRIPAKEMALLFTVAAAGPINGEQLMDLLWPDADGDAAHNAFRVCLHRLRKHLSRGQVIQRAGKAYRLEPGITVDLYQLREAAHNGSGGAGPTMDHFVTAIRRGHASRAALGEWFEPFERLLWGYVRGCHRSRVSDLVTLV